MIQAESQVLTMKLICAGKGAKKRFPAAGAGVDGFSDSESAGLP